MTQCYSMVRGSAIRVTSLRPCGSLPDTIDYGVSKSVAKVEINEVVETGGNELLKTDRDDEARIRFVTPDQTIRYRSNIQFLRVDPGILSLVAGVPLVTGYATEEGFGFGEGPFGEGPFGLDASSNVVGFDQIPRLPAKAFAMEVWSKLAGQACVDGQQQYGYTLFPFLKGGYISGFQFQNGLVSFSLVGAQTRRGGKWGIGPHDLTGAFERLETPVSRNTMWRQFITTAPPPEQTDGVVSFVDVIDNGTAADPHPFDSSVVDNGTAADPGVGVIDGGEA